MPAPPPTGLAPAPGRILVTAVIAAALLSVAHAAIFVRMAEAHPLVVAAYRLGIATVVLLPFSLPGLAAACRRIERRQWGLLAAAAVCLALHFTTWIASIDYTSIANAVVLVTLTPVWLALWTVIVERRNPGRHVLAAVAFAVAGSVIIGWGSYRLGGETLTGDLLALVGGLFMAGYLLVARSVRRNLAFLPYVTLVYGGAAALLWLPVLALALPVAGFSGDTWFALVAIALLSQVVGHGGFNWAVKSVAPTFLALTLLAEPLLSALFGWLYFDEGFGVETALGGVLILFAIWLGSRVGMPRRRAETA